MEDFNKSKLLGIVCFQPPLFQEELGQPSRFYLTENKRVGSALTTDKLLNRAIEL